MTGAHDLGGRDGFGPVAVERDEPVFHARWEARVFGALSLALAGGIANLDRFRHTIEGLRTKNKSPEHRSRIVRAARGAARVVLPERPAGSEDLDESALARWVTRETMSCSTGTSSARR